MVLFFMLVRCSVTAQHYEAKEWPTKKLNVPEMKNIQHISLVKLIKF